MGCDCIPPPPIFDLPPPPDPILIWDLISDEPLESLQKIQLKNCDFTPFNIFGSSIEIGSLKSESFLYFLIFIFTVLLTACTCATCLLRYRRCRKKRATSSSMNSSKFDSSSDTIITGNVTHMSYNSMKPTQHTIEILHGRQKMLPVGVHMYGSKSTSNIVGVTASPRAIHAATLIRPIPKKKSANNFIQKTASIRIPSDSYYTVSRHYEEIPDDHIQLPQSTRSATVIENLNHNLCYIDSLVYQHERKPPPSCRPPPPPKIHNNRPNLSPNDSCPVSPEFHDNLSSSTEPELEQIHQMHEEHNLPRSRLGDVCGRESGYGTEASRLWHSPQVLHRHEKRCINSPSHSPPSSSKSKIPVTPPKEYDQPAVQTITYV